MPTPHEEAKRAAERTGVVAGTVIAALLTVGLIFQLVSTLKHGRPIGAFLWIGLIFGALMWAQVARQWSRNIRSRRSSQSPGPDTQHDHPSGAGDGPQLRS